MKTIILIPCFNEEKNIERVVRGLASAHPELDYVIINDCSNDASAHVCLENGFNFLNLPINLGIGGCMQAGYKYARDKGYDIAVQHDGDGQHDPKFLPTLLDPIKRGEADMVVGSRFAGASGFKSTAARRLGIKWLSALIQLCGSVTVRDATSGYRAVNRALIERFAIHYAQDYPEPEAIVEVSLAGGRILEIPVSMHERCEGQSSIYGLRPLYYMIKVSLAILISTLSKRVLLRGAYGQL